MTLHGELATAAARANVAHALAVKAAHAAIVHARDAGLALLEAKSTVRYGAWGDWLNKHFAASPRQAQRYMRVASNWSKLEAKTTRVSDLSLRRAIEILDGRTELQRALALEGETKVIESELKALAVRIDEADIPELQFIIAKATELGLQAGENRLIAERECGRLIRELNVS